MKKKLILGLVAVVAVVGGVAGMSAYEAHVINVTAHIENALDVPIDEIAFGTLFPQEYVLSDEFTIGMSESFLGENSVSGIDYVINQKTKCECELWPDEASCPEGQYAPVSYIDDSCPEGYVAMPTLCPFLSKEDADPEDNNDVSHPSYFQDGSCAQPERYTNTLGFNPTGWAGWSCQLGEYAVGAGVLVGTADVYLWQPGASTGGFNYPETPFGYTYQDGETGMIIQNDGDGNEEITYYVDCMPIVPGASGELVKGSDPSDSWIIDLKVPPIAGYVGQDWPEGCPVLEQSPDGQDYGCDLWIEITGVARCGDGIVNGNEQCEIDADCESLFFCDENCMCND